MLEVGVTNTQNMPSYLSHTEARTHFALWCVTSSPLILGLDVTNATTLGSVWDIVTNTEAIAVDQDYAGMSGTLFYESANKTAMAPCGWWLANCAWPSQQYWYKRLSGGDVAVLVSLSLRGSDNWGYSMLCSNEDVRGVITNARTTLVAITTTFLQLVNNADTPTDIEIQLPDVPALSPTATYSLRDIHTHTNNGTATGVYRVAAVGSRDSVFLRFSPQKEAQAVPA